MRMSDRVGESRETVTSVLERTLSEGRAALAGGDRPERGGEIPMIDELLRHLAETPPRAGAASPNRQRLRRKAHRPGRNG